MIRRLYEKHRDIIPYGVFGVLTTIINWVTYKLAYGIVGIPNVPSTCIAWLLAVLFAFITNKLWVSNSKSFDRNIVTKEAIRFFSARIVTGVLDVVIMWLAVDVMSLNTDFLKIISNIIVVILNYIASKFVVFRK